MVQNNIKIAGRALIVSILVLFGLMAFPRSITVHASSFHVPSPEYATISAAIKAAQPGDVILVDSGTYNELIIMKSGITIQGSGAGSTFLNGGGLGTVITAIRVDETTKIDGFTITHGSGTVVNNKKYGGGIYCSNASPLISNCIIDSNKADYGAGISNLNNSSPTISQCKFTHNVAAEQGGGIYSRLSSPAIDHCQFIGNECFSTSGGGGGISNDWRADAVISKCDFYTNTAYDDGGGIYNADSNPTVADCSFFSNVCGDSGGGMRNTRASSTITNCTFDQNNKAKWGGGISNKWSAPLITNSIFKHCIAEVEGGGLHDHDSSSNIQNCSFDENTAQYGAGIAVFIETHADPTQISRCNFVNNHADKGAGAIRNYNALSQINGCTFTKNTADWGGAVEANNSSIEVKDCLFDSNVVRSNGAGILNNSNSKTEVANCRFLNNIANNGAGIDNLNSSLNLINGLFHENVASTDGGGIRSNNSALKLTNCLWRDNRSDSGGAIYSQKTSLTITNSLVRGNSGNEIKALNSTVDVSYSNVYVARGLYPDNVYPGGHNINVDPLLTSDFILSRNSPCIDTGNNSEIQYQIFDLAEKPRIQDGNQDGKLTVDMGPYEYDFAADQQIAQNIITDVSNTAINKEDIFRKPEQPTTKRNVEPYLYILVFIIMAACITVVGVIILEKIKNKPSHKS